MTKYNLYISTQNDEYNILQLPAEKLDKIVFSYKNGTSSFMLGGKKYWLADLHEIRIFTVERTLDEMTFSEKLFLTSSSEKNRSGNSIYPPRALESFGKDVTEEILGDSEFGETKISYAIENKTSVPFVDSKRIIELKNIENSNFDLKKLIRLCEEINDNYSRENYLSVAMLGRSIIDHVPPIFGFQTFNEVANNFGGSSLKKITEHLNKTMRNIADSYLHLTIRRSESLPNGTQVNFSQDLDCLLSEIVRNLNK